MQFIWDLGNIGHIARHNIEPEEVEQVFSNGWFKLKVDLRNGERRMSFLGTTDSERVLVVVVTPRIDAFRVVTSYPADRNQRKAFRFMRKQQSGQVH